jgi:hypothetical protein
MGDDITDKTIEFIVLHLIDPMVAQKAQRLGIPVSAYAPYITTEAARTLNVERCDIPYLLAIP